MRGRISELLPESSWGLATRCVTPPGRHKDTSSGSGNGGASVDWHERFVIRLPPVLCEQLLMPAPGDNQFAGSPLQVRGTLSSLLANCLTHCTFLR